MATGKNVSPVYPVRITTISQLTDAVKKNKNMPVPFIFANDDPIRTTLELPSGSKSGIAYYDNTNYYTEQHEDVRCTVFYLYSWITVVYSLLSNTVIKKTLSITNNAMFKIVDYTYAYKITTANASLTLTVGNFGITWDDEYTPIGIQRIASGSSHNKLVRYKADLTKSYVSNTSSLIMSVVNDGTVNADNVTARIRIVYLRNSIT